MRKLPVSVVLLLALAWGGHAQHSPKLNGYFTADSFKVGERVHYVLTCQYAKELNLLFPDTSYNFGVFELHSKQTFTSVSDEEYSYDSTVYTLTCFELDDSVKLTLPVYQLKPGGDSITLYSHPASIYLQRTLTPPLPDTLSLLDDTEPVPMSREPETVLMVLAGVVLVALLGIFFELYGAALLNVWNRRRVRLQADFFRQQFDKMSAEATVYACERMSLLWKKHMQQLTGVPYTSYTSLEIEEHTRNTGLAEALRLLDRTVYGNAPAPHRELLLPLLAAADAAMGTKLDELQSRVAAAKLPPHELCSISYSEPSVGQKINMVLITFMSVFTCGLLWPRYRWEYYHLLYKGYHAEGLSVKVQRKRQSGLYILGLLLAVASTVVVRDILTNQLHIAYVGLAGVLFLVGIAILCADHRLFLLRALMINEKPIENLPSFGKLMLGIMPGLLILLITLGVVRTPYSNALHRHCTEVRWAGFRLGYQAGGFKSWWRRLKGLYFSVFTAGIYAPLYWGGEEKAVVQSMHLIPKRGPHYEVEFKPSRLALYLTYAKVLLTVVFSLGIAWPVAQVIIQKFKAAHLKLPRTLLNELAEN